MLRASLSPRILWTLVGAVLSLHVVLALWAVAGKSVTADETLHVASGYFFNRYGDYRVQPENGNLPQRLAALPASLSVDLPASITGSPAWRQSDSWTICQQFFYQAGFDHGPLLMQGRALMTVFSVGTGLLVFAWARHLFGPTAGLFALALYALDPNVLAHAPLATSDSAAVFFLLASSSAFWLALQCPTWRRIFLSAVVFGLACVSKYSAVLLLPVFVLLAVWRFVRTDGISRGAQLHHFLRISLAHLAVAAGLIWLFFGLRFSGFSPKLPAADQFIVPWGNVIALLGWQGPVIGRLHDWKLLPEAFLYGYSWVVLSAQQRAAFLAGDYSTTGWVEFFPLAFWWKTTLALLAALVAASWLWARRTKDRREFAAQLDAVAPLAALFGLYALFSLMSHLNIGHRHILPLYPILYIAAGALAGPLLAPGRLRVGLLALLLAGQAIASMRIAPHYLAFFNTLAGGPANGWRLLVDSSLDWGQDLPGLKAWLDKHLPTAGEPVYLSYFGTGSPGYYDIQAVRLPQFFRLGEIEPWYEMAGGTYCISATMLQQVYSPVRGPWTPELEKEYQENKPKEPLFREYWSNPAIRTELRQHGAAEDFERTWLRYDQLRFARLCHYLRARQPDSMVGYSILIYRLTDEDLAAALRTSYSDFLSAIARDRAAP